MYVYLINLSKLVMSFEFFLACRIIPSIIRGKSLDTRFFFPPNNLIARRLGISNY